MPVAKKSMRFSAQHVAVGRVNGWPSRDDQLYQVVPSQYLWKTAWDVPLLKRSMRDGDQETAQTAGGVAVIAAIVFAVQGCVLFAMGNLDIVFSLEYKYCLYVL